MRGSTSQGARLIVGICAMDIKARSKPMRSILDRLISNNPNDFEAVIFGDQVILEDPVESWPLCDIFISFYSRGFPLEKAIAYIQLREPFCVNDLWMQYVLLDRRLVLLILDAIDVPTPPRLVVNRNGPPQIPDHVTETISRDFNLDLASMGSLLFPSRQKIQLLDRDTLQVDMSIIRKPFVEKPVAAEEHNINVYYSCAKGGGVRRLFRKVANKSSEFLPEVDGLRTDGSFIYEEYFDVDNFEDVKVYTIGPYYAYAETRKSPVVDGVVIRNSQGKELRQPTILTEEEQEMARRICMAFEQTICGFDILRVNGKSFVSDVNGWSLVKGSEVYYDRCSRIFRDTFLRVAQQRKPSPLLPLSDSFTMMPKDSTIIVDQWRLKCFASVLRHGDRTPKQKFKLTTANPAFFPLLPLDYQPGTDVTLRQIRVFQHTIQILTTQLENLIWSNEHEKYRCVIEILTKKIKLASLKIQLRRVKNNHHIYCQHQHFTSSTDDGSSPPYLICTDAALSLVVKWGGEFTHAGRHQSKDLGENMRKELLILNKRVMDDVKIYCSEERRVVATAEMFTKAFLPMAEVPPNFLETKREWLDDICIPKEAMDEIKAKLRIQLKDRLIEEPISPNIEAIILPDSLSTSHQPRMHLNRTASEGKLLSQANCKTTDSNFRIKAKNYSFEETHLPTLPMFTRPPCSLVRSTFREPSIWLARLLAILHYHRDIFVENFKLLSEAELLKFRWCCSESPSLFRERWDSLFSELLDKPGRLSPSRIPDLYDALKYEALHHRDFFQYVMTRQKLAKATTQDKLKMNILSLQANEPAQNVQAELGISIASPSTTTITTTTTTTTTTSISSSASLINNNSEEESKQTLRELFDLTQKLFDFVSPREYGLTPDERLKIGLHISGPLLAEVLAEFTQVIEKGQYNAQHGIEHGKTRLYFTKESHMVALLNILMNSGLSIHNDQVAAPSGPDSNAGLGEATSPSSSCSSTLLPQSSMAQGFATNPITTALSDTAQVYGELDYLSQICFEFYERVKILPDGTIQPRYSMRIGLSHGAHTPHLMDLKLDNRHALTVSPIKFITGYLEGISTLNLLSETLQQEGARGRG